MNIFLQRYMTVTALQVADLFDAHAVEASIHRLVSMLNAQADQISELKENLRLLQAAQRQTVSDCKTLHLAVSPLGVRVCATENDLSALKHFQSTVLRQLEAINLQLRLKADRQEVEDANSRAKTIAAQLEVTLRNELASLPFVQCLQREQKELSERIGIVEKQLVAKMDKSEAARLDGMLVQIHGFQPMATQLSTHLNSLQTQQEQVEHSVARLELQCDARHDEHEKIRRHMNEIQQSLDNMEKRHQQTVVPHILQTNDTIEHLHQTLNELKTNAVTRDTTLRTLSAKFHSSAGAFATQLQQQYRHVMNALETKAPRRDTQAQLAVLSQQLATKASETAFKSLSTSVQDLQNQGLKLQEHMELSTRFLDWFAHRGEAYEHNLELVETQLGRLAQASHPRSRDPFGERVRFPRTP